MMNICPVTEEINYYLCAHEAALTLSETAEEEILSQLEDGRHLSELTENAGILVLNEIEGFLQKSARAYLLHLPTPELNEANCPVWFLYLEEQKRLLIEAEKEAIRECNRQIAYEMRHEGETEWETMDFF